MIRRSLLTALVLLIGYQLALPWMPKGLMYPQWGQHGNIRMAESFIYGSGENISKVVVGTSLAQTLPTDALGPDYYNLAFGGGSVLSGLEVVRRSEARPPLVLVEMNYFYLPRNTEFTDDLFRPGLRWIRRHFSIFREANRPANYIAGLVQWSTRQARLAVQTLRGQRVVDEPLAERAPALAAPSIPSPSVTASAPQKVAPEVLAERLREYTKRPEMASFGKAADELAAEVKALQARGCRIVFFEMPVDAALQDAILATTVRELMWRRFPPGEYTYIPVDREHLYATRDGTHLIPSSAQAYARFLARWVADRVRDDTGDLARASRQ